MMPHIAFICPFNLDRLTGTPIRAKVTIQALQGMCEAYILATGGSLPQVHVVSQSWQKREGRPPLFRLDRFAKAALRELKAFKPDIIHAITTAAVLPAIIHKLRHRRVRLVFEMHGLASYEMRDASWLPRLAFRTIDHVGMALADAIVAMSYTQRDLLCRRFGVNYKKVHVLWGPVPLDLFRYQSPSPVPPFYVGYLGNALWWQGLDTILNAARLLQSDDSIHFLLGGFDPAPYSQLGLKNVTFAGIIRRDDAPMFLTQCHILLSTRVGDKVSNTQYPHKLSDYLAAGRPIIASDVNDQSLILKAADCGITVAPGYARDLADAIVKMSRLPEKRRLEMGLNARHFAERNLSLESHARKMMEIYLGKIQEGER